ncbi:MAG: RNase P subunit p30 family protein [Candidatus Nanoarchaeia archaeon]|nr:RNase P subunit p30 family protein [Candidatus Nanoarchaeia archaeon]
MIDLVLNNFKNPEKYGFSSFYRINVHNIKSPKDLLKIKDKIIIVKGSEFNYEVLSNSSVDILLDPEPEEARDFLHHRNSGLNKPLTDLAYKKNIIIAFSISRILNSKNQAELLGRIKQNIQICKKSRVPILISSFASNEYELRHYNDIKTFALFLGLSTQDFKLSSELFEKLLKDKEEVITPGLRILKK